MYFAKFPTITYPFEINGVLTAKTVTDITTNVRIIKEILANLTSYDEYDIKEGDTPEIIAEKVYGSPLYHWVLMITNDRYDYTTDFPLTTYELEQYVLRKYGGPVRLKTTQAVSNSTTVHVESVSGLIVGTSLQGNGYSISTVTLTDIGDLVTLTGHSLYNNDTVKFSTITKTTDISTNTKYYVVNRTSDTFQLSDIRGGKPKRIKSDGTGIITYRTPVSINPTTTYITEIINDTSFTVSDNISLEVNTLIDAYPVYGVHHYEDDNGNVVNKGNINVYGIASVEHVVSNYDYEAKLNESKRRIKLISPENLFRILAQFKSLV